jgi:hypothetical protein
MATSLSDAIRNFFFAKTVPLLKFSWVRSMSSRIRSAAGDFPEIYHSGSNRKNAPNLREGRIQGNSLKPSDVKIGHFRLSSVSRGFDHGIPQIFSIGITVSFRKRFGCLREIF